METTKSQLKNARKGFLIGLGLVVIIIVTIIALTRSESKDKKESIEGFVSGVATQEMQPYATGPFTYQFQGIDWVFDVNNEEAVGVPLTDVKVWFTDFSRHNGATVNFEKPYKLGTYQGDCTEISKLEFDVETEGTPLAYAQCVHGEEVTDLAVFQEKNMIYFKKRFVESGDKFGLIYSLDMTEIVK